MKTQAQRISDVERILAGGIDSEGNPHSGLVDAVQKLDNRVKLGGALLGALTLIPVAKALGVPTDHLLQFIGGATKVLSFLFAS
jgi:hypothetical protein